MDDRNLINKMNKNIKKIKVNKINNNPTTTASVTKTNDWDKTWLHEDTLTVPNEPIELDFDDKPIDVDTLNPHTITDIPDNCQVLPETYSIPNYYTYPYNYPTYPYIYPHNKKHEAKLCFDTIDDVFIYSDDIECFNLWQNKLKLTLKPKHGDIYHEKFNKTNRKFYNIKTYIVVDYCYNFIGDEITVDSYTLYCNNSGEIEITLDLTINKHERR